MSNQAINFAFSLNLSLGEKIVMLTIADAANAQGICWPSIRIISAKSSLEERSVQRILRRLEKMGYIEIKARRGGDGGHTSNQYQVVMPDQSARLITRSSPGDSDSNTLKTAAPDGGDSGTTQTHTHPKLNKPPLPLQNISFPKKLNPVYRQQIADSFGDHPNLQAALDELAAALEKGSISNPVLWVKKVIENLVVTEFGLRKKQARLSSQS